MLDAIEIGQVVTLQSGGPTMTIQTIEGSTAQCAWFDGARLNSEQFDAALLRWPAFDEAEDTSVYIDNFG